MTGPIVPVVAAFVAVYVLPRVVHLFASGYRARQTVRRNPLKALGRCHERSQSWSR